MGVGDQAALRRIGTVGVVEADQGGRDAGVAGGGLGDLEHRAEAVRPALVGRAKQVAMGVGDQAARQGTVGQGRGRAGVAVGRLGDLINRAEIVRPAPRWGAEQVASTYPTGSDPSPTALCGFGLSLEHQV
jgi:hypothetical protein